MIGLPFNDLRCLGSVTEVVVELVSNRDEVLLELAEKYPTTDALAGYIRSLPQRDDLGEDHDGPKVDECEPPQRLRLPAPDPNCVERAALYIGVAELIDPRPVRQMATLDTPLGLHTFPVENGAPVILDPRVPRNCLDCGVQFLTDSPIAIAPRDAIEWTSHLAEAGATHFRNGPSLVRRARDVMMRLVDEGVAPANEWEIDAMAWLLALAEGVARKYGKRALAVVRSTAQALADISEELLAQQDERNIAWPAIASVVAQNPYLSALAKVAGRVGLNVGGAALKAKLASLGFTPDTLAVVEDELNREGLTLGLAKSSRMPTFGSIASSQAA